MANLGKVIYINEEDYSTLLNGGSITKGGTTYTYDSTALYVIKDVSAPEYAETAGYATSAGSAAQATKASQDGSGNNIVNTYARKVYDDSNSDENYVSRGDTLEECITALDTSVQNNYDYHEGQLQNKADKLKNIVIVKSGTSPNYTYSLPSGVTAASIATDITTKGTMVVLSLDNEIYYYDRTTGSSSSTVLHFKYTDTTADGVAEKDLAIAYSNNAVTLTTTEYNEKLLPAVPNNHGDIIFSDLPYLNTGTPLSADFPIADAPADAPFAKCFGAITAYKTYTSEYIPVSPNDIIRGEIWAYRASGATGTAGSLYCGINRFDRNKKPIQANLGIDYFVANAIAVPTDGAWHKYSGTTTIPTTHTAYNGSDGQGVYYIQFRMFVNYNSGTIPTYLGGIKLSTTSSAKEIDIINCGTNDVDNYANTENVIRAYHFDGTAPNNMPHADNANAVIDIDTYRGAGNYNHQVGFSGNGGIYHRMRSNNSFNSWKKIGYSTDSINSSDIVLDINTWAVNDEIEKKGFYFSSIHNTLYAANLRYVVTHKIYSSVDDSYLRDALTSDIFKGSFPSDVNGAARDNEYGVLYIGTADIEDVATSGASNSITTYGQGYIILSFYASHYSPSVTGRVWSGHSNAWSSLTFTRHQYTYIAYTNATYPKALEITYQGITYDTAPRGAAVSFVEWYRTRPTLVEFPIVTKYNTPQNLYGNVTAPKFITRGGTSSQFVKGDGTLDSASTAANSLLSSLPDWTANPTDSVKLIRRDTGGSAAFGQITFLTVWNYINGKAATVYAPSADVVHLANEETITGVKTFSNGLKLQSNTSWTNSDRAIPFSANNANTTIQYVNDNSSTGLTYNPNTGALKAKSFVSRGGTSSQVVKGDGSLTNAKELPQYEAYLEWGGKNIIESGSPLDITRLDNLRANRFAFFPPSAITFEYSQDGGVTWTDYGLSDDDKKKFVSTGYSVRLGHNTVAGNADIANYLTRITFDTGAAVAYCQLNKFYISIATSGSCITGTNHRAYCTIQLRLASDSVAGNDVWTTRVEKQVIAGNSGFNIINTASILTASSATSTSNSQARDIRFIFSCDSLLSGQLGLTIGNIKAFGGTAWSTVSNLARHDHLYTYDYLQNATFPAEVSASNMRATNFISSTSSGRTTIVTSGDTSYIQAGNATTAGTGKLTLSGFGAVKGNKLTLNFNTIEATGVLTAPTAASGTNTTQVATTAFVQAAISGASGSGGVQSISCNENDILVSTTTTNTTSTAIWTALQAGKMPLLYSGTSGFSIVIQDMGGGYWSGNGVDATNKKSYNVYGYQGSIVSGVATLMAAASDVKAPLIIPVPDENDTLTSGTYASITTALAAGREVLLKATMSTEDDQDVYLHLLSDEAVNDNGYYFCVQRGKYNWTAHIMDDESITFATTRLASYSELTSMVGNIETLLAAI